MFSLPDNKFVHQNNNFVQTIALAYFAFMVENQYYFNFYAANFNNGILRLFCCIKGNWHGADCTKHITERYTK